MDPISAFRPVPRTGVIFVTEEANRLGYQAGDPDWCNLGQGQPESGTLPGAPERVTDIHITPDDHDYAPVPGLWELREAVASLYNHLYRRGKKSQYTAENVAISGGGRASLTRAAAAIAHVNLGHFLPDYTAYEELLDIFRTFNPIPILLDSSRGYAFSADDLRSEVLGRGLGAVLLSNPCNPTGRTIHSQNLAGWCEVARELACTLLVDEFYSTYVWVEGVHSVSAAEFVEDVDEDPIVLFNGLTKCWRYPGWRVTWTVGPRSVIEAVSSAGSFLDGGGSRPLQRAALPLLDHETFESERKAVREVFARKRRLMIERLREAGFVLDLIPEGTFYVWGNTSKLPESLRDGMSFFRAALEAKVITVPGEFFDVNPGQRRPGRTSRSREHVRFSFGPEHEVLETGLDRIQQIIDDA